MTRMRYVGVDLGVTSSAEANQHDRRSNFSAQDRFSIAMIRRRFRYEPNCLIGSTKSPLGNHKDRGLSTARKVRKLKR